MKLRFLNAIGLFALLMQVTLASHPFAVRCFNTGALDLDREVFQTKKCCASKSEVVRFQKHEPKIQCCDGLESSFQAYLIERSRENKVQETQSTLPLQMPSRVDLYSDSNPHTWTPNRWAAPPPDSPHHLRAHLGIWTC